MNCLLGQRFLLCKQQLLWQQQYLNNLGFHTVEEEVPDKGISTTESYSKFITIWILRNRHWDHYIYLPEKDFPNTTYFLGTTENLTFKIPLSRLTSNHFDILDSVAWLCLWQPIKPRLQTKAWLTCERV